MPARLKKGQSNAASQGTDFPELKADALSNLTARIADKLKKPTIGVKTNKNPAKARPEKSERADGEHKKDEGRSGERKQTLANQTSMPAVTAQHGKKRLRDGHVKESRSADTKGNGGKATFKGDGNGAPSRAQIEEEILALGGSKDDLDLVADVASESELEGDKPSKVPRNDLKKELMRFVQDIGIQTVNYETSESEDAEEEEEEEADNTMPEAGITNSAANTPVDREKSTPGPAKVLARGSSGLVFEPQSEWHAVSLPSLPAPSNPASLPHDTVVRIHQYAKELLDQENKRYSSRNGSSSAQQFYSTIMSSGTLSDKISALTLSVQESPVHNMKALENLVGLARKRSRGQAVDVLGALKDLFGPGALLPSDRKLRMFAAQPALSAVFGRSKSNWTSDDPLPQPLQDIHLISWAYEDWLKKTYFEVLKIIETWCNDEVVFARGKAVDYVCELLKDKPEQEANLLRLLINKLGDPDKKIASKTSYNILQLQTTHPLMKPMIIASVESELLFRPGQSLHAKYYAVITLNQTVLSGKEEAVAKKLLDIYFSLFLNLLSRPDPTKPPISAANAIIVNRKGEVQGGGGSAGKKAQKKLAEKEKSTIVDEELREKMLSAVLTGVNRAIPFTKTDDESFEKHLDTLFRVTHSSNFNTSIQALLLIQQLCGSNQSSTDRFYRTLYESLLDPRLLTTSKQVMYLNLLFRALRSDLNVKRVKAFCKRLLQVVAMHQASFTCGVLYLLRELESTFASLQAFVDQPEADESDDEENFQDAPEDAEEGRQATATKDANQSTFPKLRLTQHVYDGRKRDPEYSNAEKSCLWELTPFLSHFHPSVSLFANRLLTHTPMPAKPDLQSNTLIHFLDRFVYRNPKKSATVPRGASIMQPMGSSDASGLLVSARSAASGSKAPVNSEAFWKLEDGKVDADEVFFHRYFSALGRGKEKAKKKKKAAAADGSEAEDEEHEDEIWKALVDSRPELEGSEGDEELGMEDLESTVAESVVEMGSDEEGVVLGDDDEEDASAGVDDGEKVSLDFGEDEDEAMLGSDDEVPSDLDEAFKKELQFNNPEPEAEEEQKGRSAKRAKRRRLKNLPTFASADDYAKMLEGDDGED